MISGEMHLKNFKSLPHWSCTHYHSQKIQCLFQWGEGVLCSPPSLPPSHTQGLPSFEFAAPPVDTEVLASS